MSKKLGSLDADRGFSPDCMKQPLMGLLMDQRRLMWLVDTSSVVCHYGDENDPGGYIVEENEDTFHKASGRGISETWREAIDAAMRQSL